MTMRPLLANTLWLTGGLGDARRFRAALQDPEDAQESWLRGQLVRHARSEFGRRHEFESIHDVATYVRRVPLTVYDDVDHHVRRIANGEHDVLACGTVTHLAPTSGSSGARKLIPFTPGLTAAFNAAVNPWILDLVRQRPSIIEGPAYWSISPIAEPDPRESSQSSGIPIGFADDAEYLGGSRAWLLRQALAVPSSIRFANDTAAFWRLTLLALLRHRDLRLISIWHPSFLELLIEGAAPAWRDLLDGVRSGGNPWESTLPPSARAGLRTGDRGCAPPRPSACRPCGGGVIGWPWGRWPVPAAHRAARSGAGRPPPGGCRCSSWPGTPRGSPHTAGSPTRTTSTL